MAGPAAIPGFFGKLPSAGDFVTRGLPAAFVAPWDRWLCRHVAGLPDPPPALFFRHAGFSGVVLPSRDRAGRAFPLTLAVAGHPPAEALDALARLGAGAVAEGVAPDALAARLSALRLPDGPASAAALSLWTERRAAREADPDAPWPVLAFLCARDDRCAS